MEKIRVYVKRADRETGYITSISNDLKNLQRFVGGYVEMVPLTKNLVILCNEDGRMKKLPYNCTIAGYQFVGDIIVCGVKNAEFTDLPEEVSDINVLRSLLGVK